MAKAPATCLGMIRAVSAALARFCAGRGASAAVEFCLVAPAALVLYFGAASASDGIMTSRKVTQVMRTLIDLTSMQGTTNQAKSTPTPSNALTQAQLQTIFSAAQSMLGTKSTSTLQMTMTAVDVRNNSLGYCCTVTVRWSYTQSGTLPSCQANSFTMPSGLLPYYTPLQTQLSYLVANVRYKYVPVVTGGSFSFSPTMSRVEYMMPRSLGQVTTGTLTTAGNQQGLVCY